MDTERSIKNILDRLDAVELNMLLQDADYAKEYLTEEGIDVEEEQKYAMQYFTKVKFQVKAISAKKQDQALLERAVKRVRKVIEENSQKSTNALIELLQLKTPSIQYRKLEKWTDEEIRDVLADLDLVELMEELDEKTE